MRVPKNKARPIFRLGFFTSPAIKVTLFQASLLKIEPTIAAAIAPIIAVPAISVQEEVAAFQPFITNASVQFAFHISDLAANINPKMISPNKLSNLVAVKTV